MDISLFDFELPKSLIAQYPQDKRDESRLLIVDRKSGNLKHSIFRDLPKELDKDSLLILNNSRVIKSRLIGKRNGKSRCEVFLHKFINDSEFFALLKPHKKFLIGDKVVFDGVNIELEIVELDKDNINNRVKILSNKITVDNLLEKVGYMPLPPYIRRGYKKGYDDVRYQTIFAKKDGSVAAPTAGLHFTQEVFDSLKEKGIVYDFITLYVGIGTFLPVRERDITRHKMHTEEYEISERTAQLINQYLAQDKKIISVGTTTVRTLESNYRIKNMILSGRFSTDIFIYPGFEFRVVSGLITNFHLPKSTLFMLVCAFAGRELMLYAYNEAIKHEYRFFSYGDAMLIK